MPFFGGGWGHTRQTRKPWRGFRPAVVEQKLPQLPSAPFARKLPLSERELLERSPNLPYGATLALVSIAEDTVEFLYLL